MLTLLHRFGADERGATAIEYALITTLIGITMLSIWITAGNRLSDAYESSIASRL